MGTLSGEVPRYKVCWRRGASGHQAFAAFEGEDASAQARELCKQLLADPDVTELQFTRLDSGAWTLHIPPPQRNDAGEWKSAESQEAATHGPTPCG